MGETIFSIGPSRPEGERNRQEWLSTACLLPHPRAWWQGWEAHRVLAVHLAFPRPLLTHFSIQTLQTTVPDSRRYERCRLGHGHVTRPTSRENFFSCITMQHPSQAEYSAHPQAPDNQQHGNAGLSLSNLGNVCSTTYRGIQIGDDAQAHFGDRYQHNHSLVISKFPSA